MNLPSVKKIMTLPGVYLSTARSVRAMLDCHYSSHRAEEKVVELGCIRTIKWLDGCYNRPKSHEIIMSACDELLMTCGVESFETAEGGYIEYCNTGDTYANTICYDCATGRYTVASWGNLAEKYGSN